MYLNSNKSKTNIDTELTKKNNNLSLIIEKITHNKVPLLIGLAIIIIAIILFLFINRKVTNYLILNGEENITLYEGSDYIESGFKAYNSKDENLNSQVIIKSTLDTDEVGEYEITYTLGEIIKTRKIKVIEKSASYTYIYLKTVNNSVNVYLKVGENYTEPGYQVFNSEGLDLTSQVKVTGSVDTSKKGNYKLTYSVIDSNNVTVTASRTVIVMDTEISLSLNNPNYTNDKVTINVAVIDNYFDYIILPNNTKVTSSIHSYDVTENGTYTFTVYNTKGVSEQASIEVKNIDRTAPSGSCTIDEDNKGSIININANDKFGIKKYEYNNQIYTSNIIKLSSYIKSAKITIYDNANNTKDINCTVVPKVYIKNIQKDGVIITVNAKKVNNDITGYYFSYTNQRPNKNSGGYIATSKESIDIVRLPGTTYVWVEDKSGKISEYKTVTISNDALLDTHNNQYKILKDISLENYLKNNGWSLEELNNLMARSVRATGLYTKEAAAVSAVTLQTILAQKYKIKLPYESAGLYRKFGADKKWGSYGYNYITKTSGYFGMDCSAFVTWAYANAGYDLELEHPAYWGGYKRYDFTKENGNIGDILVIGVNPGSRHVKLIIGKSDIGFITAEASGGANGMMVTTHPYSQPNGYKIEKGECITDYYKKIDISKCPTGF